MACSPAEILPLAQVGLSKQLSGKFQLPLAAVVEDDWMFRASAVKNMSVSAGNFKKYLFILGARSLCYGM